MGVISYALWAVGLIIIVFTLFGILPWIMTGGGVSLVDFLAREYGIEPAGVNPMQWLTDFANWLASLFQG